MRASADPETLTTSNPVAAKSARGVTFTATEGAESPAAFVAVTVTL
jgi:hypothetical protein